MTLPHKLIKIGSDGYADCPDCSARIHCGTVGIANITKRHQGSAVCKAKKAKNDKKAAQNLKKNTILDFFGKARIAPAVPSSILASKPVLSLGIEPSIINTTTNPLLLPADHAPPLDRVAATQTIARTTTSKLAPASQVDAGTSIEENFLAKFHRLINSLPDSIPEATEYDTLAMFGGNPQDCDDPSLDGDDLWEEVLNGMMKNVFGWGTEGDMKNVIRRGRKGLDGLLNFVKFFVVKRCVSMGLFEGKLSHLIHALENM